MPVLSAIAATSLAAAATVAAFAPSSTPLPVSEPTWQLDIQSDVEARATVVFSDSIQLGRPLPTDHKQLTGFRTVEQRVRLGSKIAWTRNAGVPNGVSLHVEADLFSGPTARDATGNDAALKPAGVPAPGAKAVVSAGIDPDVVLAADPIHGRSLALGAADKYLLRRFAVQFESRWGRMLAGRTVSKWGLGLIAQDGVDDPFQFGFKRRGTIVDRVQLALIPAAIPGDGTWAAVFPVAFAIAADRVVEDDLASIAKGEDASNLVGAMIVKLPNIDGGLYGVRRTQVDRRGLQISAWVADVYLRWHERFGKYKVEVAGEGLMINGDTNYFRTPTNPNKLQISQLGGVVRATVKRGKFAIRLEAGLASGDQNAYDDTVRNLKFARDYRVGLVLFSDVLRRTTANTAANIADPRYAGQPPAGYERLATGGALSQAFYVHPVLRIGPFHGLSVMVGYLLARSPSKLIDPYKSGLQGGGPVGPMGGAASDEIGAELDYAVQYRLRLGPGALIVRADRGCATLGKAFADENGDVQPDICTLTGQLIARARW